MPSKRDPFTPTSILFRAHRNLPPQTLKALVDPPGTAPGSVWFIPDSVYRHIGRSHAIRIDADAPDIKGRGGAPRGFVRAGGAAHRAANWTTVGPASARGSGAGAPKSRTTLLFGFVRMRPRSAWAASSL